MIPSSSNKPYEERLSHLNLLSSEKRRLREKLIECFKTLNGFTTWIRPSWMIRRERRKMARNANVYKFIQIEQSFSSLMLSFEIGTDYHHQWCSAIRLHRLRTILTAVSPTSMFTRSVSTSRWPHNNITTVP